VSAAPGVARLWTARDLAQRWSLSEKSILRRALSGEVPSIRLGAGVRAPVRFDPIAIEAYELAHRVRQIGRAR
jgi:hypothetical protein